MLFGFAFAGFFGEFRAKEIRSRFLGNGQWLLAWTQQTQPQPAAFVIGVDGTHYDTVFGRTSTIVKGIFERNPSFEVLQIPRDQVDAGNYDSNFFTVPPPTDALLTFDPPASVTDVEFYRVYWDIGTGTVLFGEANLLKDEIQEDGSSSYSVESGEVASGTYKFVVRTVDFAGNESTNTAEKTQVINKAPGVVTSLALSFNVGDSKATLTWIDPADIGGGDVTIFDNSGGANPFPDYDGSSDTVAAGVQSFTTVALTEGVWVFGLRVNDGTNTELNSSVIIILRLDSTPDEIAGYPARPILVGELAAGGTITLRAYVDLNNDDPEPEDIAFFTNDGAGGAVDYSTAIGTIELVKHGNKWAAEFTTASFGETARIFGARALLADTTPSENAEEITLTPDNTAPPEPLNVAVVAGRP